MPTDIAELGFAIDSKSLEAGSRSLDKVTDSASRLEKAETALARTQARAAASTTDLTKAHDPYQRAVDRLIGTVQKMNGAAADNALATAKQRAGYDAAGRSADEFSKRARAVVASLEFERAQLIRNAAEQARYTALRRAGVTAESAAGKAITNSVLALQEQRAAVESNATAMTGAQAAAKAGATAFGVLRTTVLSLAAAFSIEAIISKASDALREVADLGEVADQIGITVKSLQALQFVAVQNNVGLDQLNTGIGKFSENIGKAAEGDKAMIENLQRLKVKILDLHGNLVPTEDLLVQVAQRITSIDDPARKAAAAVDFFGKAGKQMIPLLAETAKGFYSMSAAAKAAGAVISAEAIAKLDKLADSAAKNHLVMRAFFAENAADPLTGTIDFIGKRIGNLSLVIQGVKNDLTQLLMFAANPLSILPKLLSDTPADALAKKIESARSTLSSMQGNVALAATDRDRTRIAAAVGKAESDLNALLRQQGVMDVGGKASPTAPGDPDAIGVLISRPPKGVKDPAISGAGKETEDAEKKYAKLIAQLDLAVLAQDNLTAASARGEIAFESLKVHLDAQQKALDIYGKVLDATDPRLKKIEDRMLSISQGKAAETFNVATTELQKQNEILEAQIRLMNEAPDIQARELALIRAKQDAEKAGTAVTADMIDARRQAIGQNETLKRQQDEIRSAQELWTAPLKSALSSIQSTTADWIDGMLNGLEQGKFAIADFGKMGIGIARRMVSEFASLAIIRPMLGSVVGGLAGIGLVSPATASSLGYGSVAGGGASSYSMLGGFGGAGMFDFMNQPIFGASNASIAAMPMADPFAQGAMQASGSGALGGLTWGQGLAGLAGIGMGAYGLATSRNAAGAIGGGLGILGGGVGMASAMGLLPMLGAAGGPIGMGLGLAGMLIPMLFGGGEEYKWPPLAGANVRFDPGAGGYSSNATQQLGGRSIGGQFAGVGTTLDAFFNAAGGITNPGNAFSAAIWNNQREGTTSTYLISPTQGSNQQTYDESGDPSAAVDRLIAKVFYNSIQNNAAMNASATLRTAFTNREPTSTAQISGLFDLIKAYDALGKSDNITKAEQALKAIDDQFASLTAGANEWGLSLAPITEEINKQKKAYAEDFLHTIDSVLNPIGTALDDFAKERADGMKEWAYINDNVKSVVIEQAKVEEYYAKKEAALKEQLYGNAVAQLEDAIKQLSPGGALSNLDPRGQMAGLEATYRATYAQAAANDPAAIVRLAGEGLAYADYAKVFHAGSPASNAIRDEVLAGFRTIQAAVQMPTGQQAPLDANNPAISNMVQQTQVLQQLVQTLVANDDKKSAEITRLTNLLSRYITTQAA